jgi:hypothetical protein
LLASTAEELLAVADLERGNSPIHPAARAQALGRQRDLMRVLNKAKVRVHWDAPASIRTVSGGLPTLGRRQRR